MSADGFAADTLRDRLDAVLRRNGSHAPAVADLTPLPGHAGLGFSFHATLPDGMRRRLVVRTIPDGVPAVGPSDVVRQADIMQALAGHGYPTPPILWSSPDDPAFGRPYFIGGFVEGEQIPDDWRLHEPRHRRMAEQAIAAMARLHELDWRTMRAAWGEPRSLADEFARLRKLIDRPTIAGDFVGCAGELGRRLARTIPADTPEGCVHGDMHVGNMIFGEGTVRAVVDWEVAFVGATLLDIGWVASFADPLGVIPEHADRAKRWLLSAEEMIDIYRQARQAAPPVDQIGWFRAFSHYRFGVITLFNEMLHRRGKRHDPSWSETVRSVPAMMERGLALL